MKRKRRRRETSVRDKTEEESMKGYKRWKESEEEWESRYNI
jgi:hypothetical protein